MHILFLSTWFPYPPDNGAKIRVYQLLRALALQHEITLVAFAFDKANPEAAHELRTWCRHVEVISRDPFQRNRLARLLTFFSLSPITAAPDQEMKQRVDMLSKETSFDAVIASTMIMATYAQQLRNIPRIMEEHNSFSRWRWESFQQQFSASQRLRGWVSWRKSCIYEKQLARQFDLWTVVSEQDHKASQQMISDSKVIVEVVPNGVDCQRYRPGAAQIQANTLIYNGALTYDANYDAMHYFLAEIFPLIRQQLPDVSLTITGSTAGVRLAGLNLDSNVCLSGYVEDIRPLVLSSTICVVPIRKGSGSRLKILEAMALGTPVVATSKGAEGLDANHGKHLLLADDPAAFAGQVLHLLREPALRQQIAASARRLVEERYDWIYLGQRFVRLVEEAVQRHKAQRTQVNSNEYKH